MDDDQRRDGRRMRSFLLGGVVGAGAAIAAVRRQRRPQRRPTPAGLEAFEGAPCYRELVERDDGAETR